ncbi:basic amino acid ABC transporter substrate-binding protein [Natronospora cellulosivora (SeqCode)]
MNLKKVLFLMFFVFALVSFSVTAVASTYIVGTNAGFEPFEYVEDGEIVGFDIDLINEIAALQGFEVEIRDLDFASLIGALATGTIDIVIAGMTITEERANVVDFSNAYYEANQGVIVREGSDMDLTVLFGDNNIGVQSGTTGDIWVNDNLVDADILSGDVRYYESYVYMITDLVNRNIDAVVLDAPVAARFSETRSVKVVAEIITGEQYGIAVQKGNNELLELINEGLEEVRANGTMDELLDKYFN